MRHPIHVNGMSVHFSVQYLKTHKVTHDGLQTMQPAING